MIEAKISFAKFGQKKKFILNCKKIIEKKTSNNILQTIQKQKKRNINHDQQT